MATGETKLSYLDVVDDIQDGDIVPILRDGKNYMSEGLAGLNADLTDNHKFKTYSTLADIGLSNGVTVIDILNQMRNNGFTCSELILTVTGTSQVTDCPGSGIGILKVTIGSNATNRYQGVEFTSQNSSPVKFIGQVASGFGSINWYAVGLTAVSTTSTLDAKMGEDVED